MALPAATTVRQALRRIWRPAVVGLLVAFLGWQSVVALDAAFPPPLGPPATGVEVVDRKGALLRVFPERSGRWRLDTALDAIDPRFRAMVIAYEDRRFLDHRGVDLLALGRAAGQWLRHGRIVSGASTITMQLARLIEPRTERSALAKLRQMARAWQIERRLPKDEILRRYLVLAPYGGNLEGVRAASLAWFGKEPRRLAVEEAALLVALPQAPESRRPDRFPEAARIARGRVLDRLARAGVIEPGEAGRVARRPVPAGRRDMPALAPHLADAALDRDPAAARHETTLDAALQARLERVAAETARRTGPKVSVAILVAEIAGGAIRASVGSTGHLDERRRGAIDMTEAVRSPGSTLKPLIYGLALEQGLALPETVISDRPAGFHGYRPTNFDRGYQGDVTLRQALQMSLNVPAVRLLDAVGPERLAGRMGRAGAPPRLPAGERPGLSMALGGLGLTLKDLVQIYANLASVAAVPVRIGDGVRWLPGRADGPRMLSPVAAWHVADMMVGLGHPPGSPALRIAWKTGTSYGYRDAWAIGFDGRHVIGVWVGRADNGAVPGIMGAETAGPALFEAFGLLEGGVTPLPAAPPGAVRVAAVDLPPSLRRFGQPAPLRLAGKGATATAVPGVSIAWPGAGSEVELARFTDGSPAPLLVKLQGGLPPFRLLANGRPVGGPIRRRELSWQPPGLGSARLTVLDAAGQSGSVEIVLR